ncbi:DHH family phosphoesterase [Enterococcus sp. BWM-S5]|uniref:Cyclic-di-AMP phosphodiesterase n=1 Tax=Enterococcus larvae TaxID=2794352 RepID=A0ABS4CKD2_9ENTE|nr:DHH family phosphoesterase [Enterococcus larvae]MBP1047073.1 DHH family phosphoesterase [Enterococcus larvae]
MKQTRLKRVFLFFVFLFILEMGLVFFLNNKIIIIAILAVINLYLINRILNLIRRLELSNIEKIREATINAEDSIDFAIKEVPVGIITYNAETKQPIWLNPYAEEVFYSDDQQLLQLTKEDVLNYLSLFEKGKDIFKVGNEIFRFKVNVEQQTLTFENITQENTLYQEKKAMQTAIGIVSVDNYDDVTDNMDVKQVSYLNSFLTTIISDWLEEYHVFYKRLNAERYIFVSQLEDIEKMMDSKFQILDEIRKRTIEQGIMGITLSIGISYGGESLSITGTAAQTSLDMALVRGGDQVVVKEANGNSKPIYFGGKSASVAKRTRVRSRAMSTAIQGLINESPDVYIMGHRFPDMDAIGSAFGVAKLAKFYKKDAWVILNDEENIPDIYRVMEELKEYPELHQQILTPKEAMKKMQSNSLLIMVDYHKPSLSISKELYDKFNRVVIIDHHRRGDEFPDKSLLSYIESSASSASELVTELLEYQSNTDNSKLDKFDATLLLAGIVVDTKSFSVRTTARTFDVASYLRTCGADSSLVQYLLSSDLTSYLEMSQLISKNEYVTEDTVIVVGEEDKEYDSVEAAKTADTLLSMAGINAAFVITRRVDKKIGISARSNGAINVQLIMEALGGGGHFTNAATQISSGSINDAKIKLLEVIHKNIDEMYDKE